MLLRKIKSIIRPKKRGPQDLPYELTPSEMARLIEIRGHPHWDIYLSLLDKLSSFLAEDMLRADSAENVLFYRSYLLGLRRAGTIVDEIIQRNEAKDARIRESEDVRNWLRDESIAAATFGTPYWS